MGLRSEHGRPLTGAYWLLSAGYWLAASLGGYESELDLDTLTVVLRYNRSVDSGRTLAEGFSNLNVRSASIRVTSGPD